MNPRKTIRRVQFAAPLPLGMEVMTLEQLHAAAPVEVLSRPLRPDFHSLLLVTGGQARHAVDFVEHRLEPGSVLWIRPGQVQLFIDDRLSGDLVLFQSDFLIPGTRAAAIADNRFGPATTTSSAATRSAVDRARRELRRAYAAAANSRTPTVAQTETLRHMLSVLILSFDAAEPARSDSNALHSQFLELLELEFASAHDAGHYARRLGYSLRTLTRATQAATGESPKQAISSRITLEARRLLAHSNRPVSIIAHELGFGDPSNFSAFFARQTGETPTSFRQRAA